MIFFERSPVYKYFRSRRSASSSLKHQQLEECKQQLEVKAAPHKTVRLYLSPRRSCGPPLVDLARRLAEQEGVPPVTCVVLSRLTSFVLCVVEAGTGQR
ncbi:UDP-glycosyltransferase 85A4 [Hordeum vulgare]|nr:UDP-glycosyltransferase 85A4 [Hordeum vulgare]